MTQPPSPIIKHHLDALTQQADAISPEFIGLSARDMAHHADGGHANKTTLPISTVRPALQALSPMRLFIDYTEAYIADPNLFKRPSIAQSLDEYIGILRDIVQRIGDPNDDVFMYYTPRFEPSTTLNGTNLIEKSSSGQKLHAVDIMLQNPNILIAYAVIDAVYKDYFNELADHFKQPPAMLPKDWNKTKSAAEFFNALFNDTARKPIGMGIVHGPLVHGYFTHLCAALNDGRVPGNVTQDDITTHIQAIGSNGMFDGGGKTCAVKEMFLASALGVGARHATATEPKGTQRLWRIIQLAQHDPAMQALVNDKLGTSNPTGRLASLHGDFELTIREAGMEGGGDIYTRPAPRVAGNAPSNLKT